MARARGGTTSLSNGCGAASNMRRCICGPTTASAKPAFQSAVTSTSTTAADHTKALTAPHPIKPTSLRYPSAWQPNPGRRSTYRRGDSVQTTATSSTGSETAVGWFNDTIVFRRVQRAVLKKAANSDDFSKIERELED